ncbi:putative multi-domain containing protein, partial [Aduncisulcus paluster]
MEGRERDRTVMLRGHVAALIDHTLLKPEATPQDVQALIAEAVDLGVLAVCVSPSMLPLDVPKDANGLIVAAVAHEAALAAAAGATEIDMVIDVGAAVAGDFAAVQADIEAVRRAAPTATLKVIIESAALLERAGADAVRAACRASEAAGADFVKTSTGFHPSGGATVEAVRIMSET